MAASADVESHLSERGELISRALSGWAHSTDLNVNRTLVVADYFKGADIGEVQRVGNGSSLLIARETPDPALRSALVIGSHDTSNLGGGLSAAASDVVEPPALPGSDTTISGVGVGSRFGPTLAFVEGFKAARQVTSSDPINLSVLTIGPGDDVTDLLELVQETAFDAVYLTNSVAWSPEHPTITTGCRGRLVAELSLTAGRGVLDAATAGAIRNPLHKLVEVVGRLRNERGRVTIPGFYDRAVPPTFDLRESYVADDHDPSAWVGGIAAPRPNATLSMLERVTAWPLVSLLSVDATNADFQSTPTAATATVAIYLVPDQRHAEIETSLRSWFLDQVTSDLQPSVRIRSSQRPYRSDNDDAATSAQTRAAFRIHGRHPILVPGGGAFGAGEIADQLAMPVGFAGVCGPEHGFGTRHESYPRALLELSIAHAADTCLQLRRTNVRSVS